MKRILVALLISAVTLLSACNQIKRGEVGKERYDAIKIGDEVSFE